MSMTAVMVIRPRGDGDVEEAADDEIASGTVGDKSYPLQLTFLVVL